MKRQTIIFVGIQVAVFLVIATIFLFGQNWRYHEMCTICGAKRESCEYSNPWNKITAWTRHGDVEPSPLTLLLKEKGVLAPHQHEWRFLGGSEYRFGRSTEHGESGRGHLGLYHNTRAARPLTFMRNLIDYKDKETVKDWLLLFLNPKLADSVDDAPGGFLKEHEFPENGFAGKAAFEEWWKRQDDLRFVDAVAKFKNRGLARKCLMLTVYDVHWAYFGDPADKADFDEWWRRKEQLLPSNLESMIDIWVHARFLDIEH